MIKIELIVYTMLTIFSDYVDFHLEDVQRYWLGLIDIKITAGRVCLADPIQHDDGIE